MYGAAELPMMVPYSWFSMAMTNACGKAGTPAGVGEAVGLGVGTGVAAGGVGTGGRPEADEAGVADGVAAAAVGVPSGSRSARRTWRPLKSPATSVRFAAASGDAAFGVLLPRINTVGMAIRMAAATTRI